MVDSAQLDAFWKEQRDLTSKHIKLLNSHLGDDADAGQRLVELETAQGVLQDRLDQ